MPTTSYIEEAYDDISSSLAENVLLLITATDTETKEVHRLMQPLPDHKHVIQSFKGNLTLYCGVIGLYKVVHLQCSMGSISRDSSIMTTSEALQLLNAKVVIMPGIAFGIDPDKQRIGDLLVAEAVQPYNNKRVSADHETQRAYATHSDRKLLNRFKNLKSWEYLLPDGQKAQMDFALMLSGEELIDNKSHRDELIGKYPTALGGEMEGAGVYSACDGKASCILIKGICDFADGEKGKNKKQNQQVAIESAMSACVELLNSKTAFSELGLRPIEDQVIQKYRTDIDPNEVLFEVYDNTKEPYYMSRSHDLQFEKFLPHTSIWIHGPSGGGKSSIIMRNLNVCHINYVQVNLASCLGRSIDSFFLEILLEVASKIEGVHTQVQPTDFNDSVKLLLGLLAKHYSDQELVIFVEEIPLESDEDYQNFTQKIYSILVTKALNPSLNKIRFVLSSINDPTVYIQSFNQKVHMHMKFMPLELWAPSDINKLITLINGHLHLPITEKLHQAILEKSKKSPRFIKKYFRNAIFLNCSTTAALESALIETEREFKFL